MLIYARIAAVPIAGRKATSLLASRPTRATRLENNTDTYVRARRRFGVYYSANPYRRDAVSDGRARVCAAGAGQTSRRGRTGFYANGEKKKKKR